MNPGKSGGRGIRLMMVCCLLAAPFHILAEGMSNRLAGHASPYLAMHARDPVHWQEWNEQTFELARRENKMIYVSSGYFSCHWCHVMQRESYQNQKIAAILNKYFIPVKADRELNPALDAKLIDFVERTRGYAGWPLNVFITPQGYPLVGLVYLPPTEFSSLLNQLKEQWQADHKGLKKLAFEATQELSAQTQPQLKSNNSILTDVDYMRILLEQTWRLADEMQGGFGQQNKFPSVPQLTVLLKVQEKKPNQRLKTFLQFTLDHMASQGLRDHLGGGFFRYSVDPGWQVPHFEKMLYDNALLAQLYLQAAQQFDNQDYEHIGRETLDFMLTGLATQQGALATSLSAVDEQGSEGGYYLWHREELDKILNSQELQLVMLLWQLEGSPELEGGHHLIYAIQPDDAAKELKLKPERIKTLLRSARSKMLVARAKRSLPLDNKKIAAWNGLALSALVAGARLKQGEHFQKAAQQIRHYLTTDLWDGQRLMRARGKNAELGVAGLEDYSFVARGMLDWAELTGMEQDVRIAEAMIKQAWQRFYTAQGWLLAENMLLKYGAGEKVITDGPMPSPSALLIDTTLRLAKQTNNTNLLQKAKSALTSGHDEINEAPFWYATQIGVVLRWQKKE